MFQKKQNKFQVQNVLFVMLANPVHIRELLNSARNSVCFGNTAVVEGHDGCPLLSYCPLPHRQKSSHVSLL